MISIEAELVEEPLAVLLSENEGPGWSEIISTEAVEDDVTGSDELPS